MNPTDETIEFWEKVVEDSEFAEMVAFKYWQDAKNGDVLADANEIHTLYLEYAVVLRTRNLNVKTLRGIKEKLKYSIHKSQND